VWFGQNIVVLTDHLLFWLFLGHKGMNSIKVMIDCLVSLGLLILMEYATRETGNER